MTTPEQPIMVWLMLNRTGNTGEQHPIRVLLEARPVEGQQKLWTAFEAAHWNFAETARRLGVGRLSLRRWLAKFDLMAEYQRRRADAASAATEDLK